MENQKEENCIVAFEQKRLMNDDWLMNIIKDRSRFRISSHLSKVQSGSAEAVIPAVPVTMSRVEFYTLVIWFC